MMNIKEVPSKLEVKKVRMTCDTRPKRLHQHLDWNAFWLIVGAPGSGKTNLLHTLFNNRKRHFYYKKFHKVYLFSPSLHTVKKRIPLPDDQKFHFFDRDKLQDLIASADDDHHCLFIFDDLIKELSDKVNLNVLLRLIYNRRHIGKGCTIMITAQKYNKLPRQLRVATSNLVIFNKSKIELDDVFHEFCNLTRKEFDQIVKHVFQKQYDFLYIRNTEGETCKYYRNFNQLLLETH